MPERTAPRGFALIEVFVLVMVMAGLLAMLTLALSDARRTGGLGRSIANMKRLGVGSASYVADNQQMTATFWWSATEGHSEFSDLEDQRLEGGLLSASAQAVDIMRRLHDPSIPPINNWLPHIFYSHLVLIDYLDEELPTPWVVSPGSKTAQGWQDDIDLPGSPPANKRWRYYSSYEIPPAFWERELGDGDQLRRIRQGATHNSWQVGSNPLLGSRSFDDVQFPSEKAHAYERYQRFFGPRDAFFTYPEARVPVLLADGHVSIQVIGEANPGWDPQRQERGGPTLMLYSPAAWEPDTLSGESRDRVSGMIRWTRGGAKGRDFGGDEIDTGQR